MKTLYTAEALATGEGRDGHGRTSDGKVDVALSIPKEMGGTGTGTNPEQLFAVGSRVSLGSNDAGGFVLAVELEITLPNVDHDTAQALAEKAHQVCPYSNATRGNIDVVLTVTDD